MIVSHPHRSRNAHTQITTSCSMSYRNIKDDPFNDEDEEEYSDNERTHNSQHEHGKHNAQHSQSTHSPHKQHMNQQHSARSLHTNSRRSSHSKSSRPHSEDEEQEDSEPEQPSRPTVTHADPFDTRAAAIESRMQKCVNSTLSIAKILKQLKTAEPQQLSALQNSL